MNELIIYFEINGLASDEHGNPCPAGMQLSLGETEKQVDYSELTRNINIPGVLKLASLDGIVKPEDVTVLTPEEYQARYSDK